jgi:hypothetical protein
MAGWAEVIRAHAGEAFMLYGERMREVERLAGIEIMPDGSNTAVTPEHVDQYLEAIRETVGETGYLRAACLTHCAQRRLGLEPGNNLGP